METTKTMREFSKLAELFKSNFENCEKILVTCQIWDNENMSFSVVYYCAMEINIGGYGSSPENAILDAITRINKKAQDIEI
jgi:hypothetical protein